MNLKKKLADPTQRLCGQVCVIPSAVVTQALAAAGSDFVIIDQEHAPIGAEMLHAMIAATAGTECGPLVRVTEIDEGHVKRSLDAGAEGILFPMIRTADDARRCVAATRYPPDGRRGWGPFVAHSRWRTGLLDYTGEKGGDIVCGLLIETVDALANIEEICAVEGVDFALIAMFDLSTELGVSGQFDHPKFIDAEARLERAILAAGVPLGGAAFSKEQTEALAARGYRLFGSFDVLWLKGAVTEAIGWMREAGV